MQCEQFQRQLDYYLDGDLELREEAELHAHLDRCPACRERLRQAQEVLAGLRAIPVPAMTPGFAQKAVSQAASQRRPRPQRRAFVAGFGTAMVAGIAMLMVLGGVLPTGQDQTSASPQQVAISVAAPRTVNLAFDVRHSIDDATLSIELPEHVEVVGFPGMRRLTWQTDLVQGRNILPLPLQGSAKTKGDLKAKIEHGGKQTSVHIRVSVEDRPSPQAGVSEIHWV